MNKKSTLALAVSALLAGHCGIAFADLESVRTFDIPPQPLASALLQFSSQADVQVVGSSNSLTDLATPGINGRYTGSEALRRLIGGNPVNFEAVTSRSVRILPQGDERANKADAQFDRQTSSEKFQRTSVETSANAASSATSPTVRLAQGAASPESEQGSAEANNPTIRLEEVIVTGSHIRGAQNLSSPVIRFDREDIERSGYATTQQLIQGLPQNLNSISDSTLGSLNGGAPDNLSYNGSGVNLRGLGGDATLVLLNGRRLAAAGNGSFVDVSLIPLSAIERIEVLTDGASAIYGSDAVGGVVNMTTRKDFSGAETRIRYGSVTKGNHDEVHAGQMLGHAWNSGQALISYDYYRRTELHSSDRDLFRPIGWLDEATLIPKQSRQGILTMLSQQLAEDIELYSDAFYGERQTVTTLRTVGSSQDLVSEMKQLGGVLGLKVDVAGGWQLRASGAVDRNESDLQYIDSNTRAVSVTYGNESSLASLEIKADGPLANTPGGVARLALGGQHRSERFVEEYSLFPARLEREISAAYAEVLIPWISSHNRRPGFERMELTVAGRYESYSDFGSTINPKIGLSWAPVSGLNVRSTWGTSFKAPLLSQVNQGGIWAYVYPDLFRDGSGGAITGMVLSGNGESLGPEESTNWTLGFDLESLDGFALSLTYFDINYDNRIRPPFPGDYDIVGSVLSDQTYAALVTRGPDPAYIARWLATPNSYCYVDFTPCDVFPRAEDVAVVIDGRVRNFAGVRTAGIDFSVEQRIAGGIGDWHLQLTGTHLLKNRERIAPSAPDINEMNNVWRPVELRLRAGASVSIAAANIGLFVNYTDGYRDTRTTGIGDSLQRRTVGSWTTMDLNLQYKLGRSDARRWLGDTTFTLAATNLLDRDPPYVANSGGYLFDGVNANPLGRFISAQVTARW